MLTRGAADEVLSQASVEASAQVLRRDGLDVQVHIVPGKGHAMVGGPQEAEALMRFWSRHLSSLPVEGGGGGGGGRLVELSRGGASLHRVS
jgi:hypothetical protein